MKFILDLEGVEGKTVKSAKFVSIDEALVIIFTDETCCYIDVDHYGDSYELKVVHESDVSDYEKRDAGIITQSEYEELEEKRNKRRRTELEQIERRQLEELKKKYESN